MGKGENAGYQHFLLFRNVSTAPSSWSLKVNVGRFGHGRFGRPPLKVGIVRSRIKEHDYMMCVVSDLYRRYIGSVMS